MKKFLTIGEKKILYESENLGNKYGDGDVVRVICQEYSIDEEFSAEDMPSIFEFMMAEQLATISNKNHKTQISLRVFTQDLDFFKKEAEKTGENYGELMRDALAEYRKKHELQTH